MYRAKHLAETNQELASLLFTRKESVAPLEESNREADSEKKRKLARMQAVRAQQGIENVPQSLLVSGILFLSNLLFFKKIFFKVCS